MPLRRLGLSGNFTALCGFALAVMFLAAAPIVAGGAEAQPHGMAMTAMSAASEAPCAAMADHSGHPLGNHAKCCLALCLAGQGALLPEAAMVQTAWLHPAMPIRALFASELLAHPPSVDPPPPRRS